MDDDITGMYELLDAIEGVIKAADPAKREALARTIDAWANDFPEDFLWAVGPQAPTLMTMNANDLAQLVKQRIENLRPKLLDLSRRNPLIATKLGPRSNSHIRVVDELPDILFYKLNNGQELPLVPLPAIDDDPRDERTRAFRDALINARLTDEQYLAEMESVERDADDYIDRTRQIERALKDRVREALGLPQRTNKNEVNLVHHARINGITPSYELPTPDAEHADGRHNDDNIQTLLLPNDLERKLNSIVSKCGTWVQETGMNVLHLAYGFLEWSDGVQSESSFAPLILCEAKIERRRTSEGVEFSISGTGDEPEINAVLAEKLRLDFRVELPAFAGSSAPHALADVHFFQDGDLGHYRCCGDGKTPREGYFLCAVESL